MDKLRCAILDDYQGAALAAADWERIADRVALRAIPRHLASEDDVVTAIGDCQIVVVMRERTRMPASLLQRLPNLQLLVTTGMRNAAIDVPAAHAQGIVVCGTASRLEPPAELTWALILALARSLVPEAAALRAGGPWQSTVGTDLHGRTLGLLGLGRIGSHVARIGRAFGMNVVAWSQHLTVDRTGAVDAQLAPSLEQLLETSDVVSIHLVLSDRTRGLIGAAELRRMKGSAYLVNTSRAAIVDQAALLQALQDGWIAGAGVDVFEEEPLPADHPLRTAPNLLATPHLGYVTRTNYATFYGEAVEDIAAFLEGAPIRRIDS